MQPETDIKTKANSLCGEGHVHPYTAPSIQSRKRSPRYAFADYLLDTQADVLDRAGLAIPLRPKVFHALEFLIEHRDRTVTVGTSSGGASGPIN